MNTLFTTNRIPFYTDAATGKFFIGNYVQWTSHLNCDGDGAPNCYAPTGSGLPALDYLANAGYPGNWWGIACNFQGTPYMQPNGYYVSTTAYQNMQYPISDPQRYLDATKIPYIVVPGHLLFVVGPKVKGCRGQVRNIKVGKIIPIMVGDVGGNSDTGEGSVKLCQLFGLDDSPKNGGDPNPDYEFTIWPGQAADGYELQAA